ncbi:MAG: MBL fold metallo-hydrolase [Clostridia bacterium]|nr:MBL fold metallo-hydrolase [Clostridia bacterium]
MQSWGEYISIFAFSLCKSVFLCYNKEKRKGVIGLRHYYIRVATFLLLLCCCLQLIACTSAQPAPFSVEVLDVGQSDCTLVRCDDTVLMIDTGTATARSAVQVALQERKIDRIDYLLLTHPHEDHVGNARMLLESYEVGELILPATGSEDFLYTVVLETAAALEVLCTTAQGGMTFSVGAAILEILLSPADANDENLNNGSIISRILYGNTVFLFTGDAESEEELLLLSTVPAEKLDCHWFKAGHHGSDTAMSAELLAATTPAIVAISCGKDNDYGFPRETMLKRLEAVSATWQRTDLQGTLRYISDGESVAFQED